jgi:hypothetical protein
VIYQEKNITFNDLCGQNENILSDIAEGHLKG